MIDELVNDLKEDEGFVPHAYRDHLGYLTIGYGFMIDHQKGGQIPESVAEYWLHYEVFTRWNKLVSRLPWLNEQPEGVQRALGNMAYQLGLDGVCKFRNMLQKLQDGDRAGAAEDALDSKWAKQTPNRAAKVASLIRG